jgi:VIT1/CCC1 family predicted Fe2+/Mn2+ transporter
MQTNQIKKYSDYIADEKNSAAIYQALAEVEKDERIAGVYQRMASIELKHAAKWEKMIRDAGEQVPEIKLSWRTRMLIRLAKRFGPELVLPGIQAMENNGTGDYANDPEAQDIVGDEKSHSIVLGQISKTVRGGMEGSALALLEGRHRSTGGNALRAAVLGANDGLVSNLSLVMGVAGASMDNKAILIAGLAGLLAGACSMALGEWLSVQSSRELYSHQIGIEKEEIAQSPAEEAEELALIYETRGLDREQASKLAHKIMENKDSALDTLAREELGVDPEELGGSAWEAAITSFVLFAIGAIIPVIPFIFASGLGAIALSVGLSTIGLFLLGTVITLFTGRSVLYSGMRMVIFGLLAALVTFGIGKLIGTSVAG